MLANCIFTVRAAKYFRKKTCFRSHSNRANAYLYIILTKPKNMIKKIALFATLIMVSISFAARAQAFDEKTKMLTVSIGGADMIHIPTGYTFYTGYYTPLTGEVSVEGEFAVHKYVGVGFYAALGGRGGGFTSRGLGAGLAYSGYYSEFNIPVAAVANFHFYQLIADKTGKESNMKSDALDIYAGVSLGSGIAIHPGYTDYLVNNGVSKTATDILLVTGFDVGIRYWFTPKIGINGEFGWGKTLGRVGVTFAL